MAFPLSEFIYIILGGLIGLIIGRYFSNEKEKTEEKQDG